MKQALLAVFLLCLSAFPAHAAERETTFDRVMRTGTIRCGYVHWEPALKIDPNTRVLSGSFHDLAEEVGKRLSLKVEWTEEVGWATAIEGMVAGRYDAACSSFYPTPARARRVDFSQPVSFSPVYLYVRPGSPLLGRDEKTLDTQDITFAYIDGAALGQITEQRWPKSKKTTYPDNTPWPDFIDALAKGKGDLALAPSDTMGEYLKAHPGALVRLTDKPFATFPNGMLLPMGDVKMKSMIDTTIRDILYDGTFARILEKHGLQDIYLPVPTYKE